MVAKNLGGTVVVGEGEYWPQRNEVRDKRSRYDIGGGGGVGDGEA